MATTGTSRLRSLFRRSHQARNWLSPAKVPTSPASTGKNSPRWTPPLRQGMRRGRTPRAMSSAVAAFSEPLNSSMPVTPRTSVRSPAIHSQGARRRAAMVVRIRAASEAQLTARAEATLG